MLLRTILPILVWIFASAACAQDIAAVPTERPVYNTLWSEDRDHSLDELAALARSDNAFEREFAVAQLADLAQAQPAALDLLVRAAGDRDLSVRLVASAGLSRLDASYNGRLLEAFAQPSEPVGFSYFSARRNRRKSLGLLASDLIFTILWQRKLRTQDFVAAYQRLLPSARPEEFTGGALWNLGTIREGAREVEARTAIQRLLLLLAYHVPDDPQVLLMFLNSDHLPVVDAGLRSLNKGEVPDSLVPTLAKIVAADNAVPRESSIIALAKGRGPAAREQFARLLQSPDEMVRKLAVASLAPDAPNIMSALQTALGDPSQAVRETAIKRAVVSGAGDTEAEEKARALDDRAGQIDFDLPEIILWNELRACEEDAEERPTPRPALPEEVISLILAERDRIGASSEHDSYTIRQVLRVIACTQPRWADRLIQDLTPDLSAKDEARRKIATVVLGQLARSGHDVDVSTWFISGGEKGEPETSAPLRYGRFQAQALDVLLGKLRGERHHPWGNPYVALDANEKMRPLIRERVVALLEKQGPASAGEATLAVTGLPPTSTLPAALLAFLKDAADDEKVELAETLIARGWRLPQLPAALEQVLTRGGSRDDGPAAQSTPRHDFARVERWRAVKALLKIGGEALPVIRRLIEESAPEMSVQMIDALVEGDRPTLLPTAQEVLPSVLIAAKRQSPQVRASALTVLGLLSSPPNEFEALLNEAIRHPDATLRRAAVSAWANRGYPIGSEIRPLLTDQSRPVREIAVKLVARMPDGDERRELLEQIVQGRRAAGEKAMEAMDREPNMSMVTDGEFGFALETAAATGPAGKQLVNDYLKSDALLDWNELQALAPYVADLEEGFIARLQIRSGGSERRRRLQLSTRENVVRLLAKAADRPAIRRQLLLLVGSPAEPQRDEIVAALLEGRLDPWRDAAGVSHAFMLYAVRELMKSWLGGTLDKLYPYWGPVHHSGRGERLPKFPWPPPAGFKTQFISDSVLGRRPKTLGEVYDLLTSTLSRVDGFEWGLFGNVPGGFALLARMERIRQDGSPYPGQSRWATDGTPLLSFKDFLAHMFLDPPGYFRVIAFVVTDDVNFDSAALASLPGIGAGERSMPDDLRAVPFDTDRKLLALVYSYERKPGARISPLEASWAPNAQQHLKAAGILAAFAQP